MAMTVAKIAARPGNAAARARIRRAAGQPRHVRVNNLLDPLLGLALAGVGLALSGHGLSCPSLASFSLLLVAAMPPLYAPTLVLMAVAVILVAAEELGQLSFAVVELGRFRFRCTATLCGPCSPSCRSRSSPHFPPRRCWAAKTRKCCCSRHSWP
jgi:hypothetical protein